MWRATERRERHLAPLHNFTPANFGTTGSYQGLTDNFFKFAEFTLTIADAQEYAYSISPTKRVRGWHDIEVKLYI